MNITLKIEGVTRVNRNIVARSEKIAERTRKLIAISALRIQSNARRQASKDPRVRTGRLRSSITVQFLNGGFSAVIGTRVFYGPFVEYGTRRMTRPHPFLTPAYEKELPKLRSSLRGAIKT